MANELTGDENLQYEGIRGGVEQRGDASVLLADPLLVNSFIDMVAFMVKKVAPQIRKIAFDRALAREQHERVGDVFFMPGAKCNETERQTAQKLTKAGFFVVFPGQGQLKAIKEAEGDNSPRVNDVFIYDKRTYLQRKVDLKTVNGASVEAISDHITSGSGQAPVVALDIIGNISKMDLIKAIHAGWTKETKSILFNYRGQWYEIKSKDVYKKGFLLELIK